MATEQAVDRRSAHIRSVTVTTLTALAGIGAGLLSSALAATPKDSLGLYILGGAILVELLVMRVTGVDVSDFSTKDYLYVAFMTFSLWFITWAILLTSNTTVSF